MHPHLQSFIVAALEGRCVGMALALAQMRAVVTDDALDPTLIEPLAGLCQRAVLDLTARRTSTSRVIFPDVWAVVQVDMRAAEDATHISLVPTLGAPSFVDQWRAFYPTHLVVQRMRTLHHAAQVVPRF
jgi:hypothetical protein